MLPRRQGRVAVCSDLRAPACESSAGASGIFPPLLDSSVHAKSSTWNAAFAPWIHDLLGSATKPHAMAAVLLNDSKRQWEGTGPTVVGAVERVRAGGWYVLREVLAVEAMTRVLEAANGFRSS